jgi:hypothetical protein
MTLEEKIQMALGAQMVEIMRLSTMLEEARARIAKLEAAKANGSHKDGTDSGATVADIRQ